MTIPPRVDYALTALGRSLLVPVTALSDWALKNIGKIEQARTEFDGACPEKKKAAKISPAPIRLPSSYRTAT